MKRFAFLMTILLIAGGVTMAQGRMGNRNMDPKQRAEQMTEQMVKDYSLTDAQKEKVHVINLEMAEKMSKISGDDREARRESMQKIREEYNTKLKDILTKEQYDAYTKSQAERRERMRNR